MMELPGFQAGDLMLVILDTKKRALSHQQQQHRDGFSTGTMLLVAVIIVALAFACCFIMYVVLISTTKFRVRTKQRVTARFTTNKPNGSRCYYHQFNTGSHLPVSPFTATGTLVAEEMRALCW